MPRPKVTKGLFCKSLGSMLPSGTGTEVDMVIPKLNGLGANLPKASVKSLVCS